MRDDRSEPQFGYNEPLQTRGSSRDAYPVFENSPRRRRRSLVPMTLTGIALILFGAALWFTYTGHKRGANGEPPVIAADTTPVKVKPDQPGGMSIPYQDTTVYDQLATGRQKQEAGVEHLLQPPEQPLPKPLPAPVETATVLPPPSQDVAATAETAGVVSTDPAALAPPPAVSTAPAAPVSVPQAVPAPPVSDKHPVPPSKPAANLPTPVQTAALTPPAPKPVSAPAIVAPTAAGSGFMLQLGAFHDEATANSDWQSAKAAHPSELGALHPLVEKITAGDKTLYRLKAGPLGEAQARQNCTSLKAASVVCIVVPQ